MAEPEFSRIIRSQIGVMTMMATGARDFVYSTEDNYLMFTVGRGNTQKIKVTLTPSDTYTVERIRINRKQLTWTVVESVEYVYADSLSDVVYRMVNK